MHDVTMLATALLAMIEGGGDGGAARVLERSWEWQARWPAGVLVGVLLGAWLVVAVIHRSRRIELSTGWRVGLGLLRAAILAVPVLMLLQPQLVARLERLEPRTLAVLLDRSGSMSLKDGPQAEPASRWQQAADALGPAIAALADPNDESVASRQGPRVSTYLFSRTLEPVGAKVLSEPPSLAGPTAIGDALWRVQSELRGRPAAGVLIVSDGAENASSADHHPLRAARELARVGIPVHACLVGSERPRDAAVSAVAESPFAFADDPVPLSVRVEHQGLGGRVATVTVSDGQHVVATRDLTLSADTGPVTEHFEVKADAPGRKRYVVQIAPLPGELTTSNNRAAVEVTILDQPLRVLYVERWPRWQYRFLRNAMVRDPRFQPALVLLTEDPATPAAERQTALFPATAEELAPFDVVILGDLAPRDLSPQQWGWLHDHVVEAGAGAVLVAGTQHTPASFIESPIGPLLPFNRVFSVAEEDVTPFKPALTPMGRCHPLMRLDFGDDATAAWNELPPLGWYAGVADVKPGAMVLAERPAEPGEEVVPLIILQRAGRGSVLFVGMDETWKWRYQVGNRYFYRFWAQAIQHVGMPHRVGEFRTVRIHVPNTIAPGSPTSVTVAIDATAGAIETAPDAKLTLAAESVDGGLAPVSFALEPMPDAPLVYEGKVRFDRPGRYRLFVERAEQSGDAVVEVSAERGGDPELANPAVNAALLRQIADVSGGEFVTLDQLPAMIARLDLSPLRYQWVERIGLWDTWTMLLVLAALLIVEWIVRKWRYLP